MSRHKKRPNSHFRPKSFAKHLICVLASVGKSRKALRTYYVRTEKKQCIRCGSKEGYVYCVNCQELSDEVIEYAAMP